jgi:hypothetical protein
MLLPEQNTISTIVKSENCPSFLLALALLQDHTRNGKLLKKKLIFSRKIHSL